jgi:DNA-binding transcriptional ArsR family regulator
LLAQLAADTAELLEAALGYAARGIPVFPLHLKQPAIKGGNGYQDATLDERQILHWWDPTSPRRNTTGIGAPAGIKFDLFDVDLKGFQTMEMWTQEHGKLPPTPTAKSGSGGLHYLWQPHPGLQSSTGTDTHGFGPGVDVKATGGYAAMPPSLHETGNRYMWLPGRSLDDIEIAPWPQYLINRLQERAKDQAGPAPELQQQILEGNRNSELASLAGTLRRRGCSQVAINAALQVMNTERCRPPLPVDEVEAIAESVSRYRPAEPRVEERPALRVVEHAEEVQVPDTPVPLAQNLQEFLQVEDEDVPAVLGTPTDAVIPEGGLAFLCGLPGVGKSTLTIDLAFHLASGVEWLGVPIEHPRSVLFIENEGPQRKFREKLRKKAEKWPHKLEGNIHVQTWRWGHYTFRDEQVLAHTREWLQENPVDLIVGDPLDSLGTAGVGSPDETRDFLPLLVHLGMTRDVAFLFLHHPRKEQSVHDVTQLSGAWGQRLDTLLMLRPGEHRDEVRLNFSKLRWAEERDPLILGKVRELQTFEVLGAETQDDPGELDAMRQLVLAALRAGPLERQELALKCGSATTNRTFTRALSALYKAEKLAREQEGRKTTYSLAPAAYQ